MVVNRDRVFGHVAKRAFYAYAILLLLFLVMPMLVIVPLSFNPESFFTYPLPGLSLRWYHEFFASASWRTSLMNSLVIASATTILATVIGTLAALGLTLGNFRFKSVVIGLFLSPIMVPHIIIGLGMYFFYAWLGIINTLLGMILAHTTLAVPFVVLTVSATLSNFKRNLIRAASNLGASPWVVFRTVIAPLILPGLLAGGLFAFMTSFDELIVALLLSGSEYKTLPRQMWSGIREEISPVITTVATLLIVFSITTMGLAEWLRRRSERLQRPPLAAPE